MKRGLGSSSHDAEQKRARADAGLDGDTKLLRQLEYYFSDASFGFDEHLQSAADASGAVAASVLATFPRVLALTEAVAAADRPAELCRVAALSDTIVVVEGGEGGGALRRRYPLPSADPAAPRSVWLQGFPREADEAEVTRLLSAHGRVVGVRRLRNQHDRLYNGQVYVELEDAGKAAALAQAAADGAIAVGERVLRGKLLSTYFREQEAAAAAKKARKQAQRDGGGRGGGGGGGGDYSAVAPPSAGAAVVAERGRILRFEGAGADADREAVKKLCSPHGSVAFVDYNRGEAAGYVRFRAAAAARAALAAAPTDEGSLSALTWSALDGDEEEAYLQAAQQKKRERDEMSREHGTLLKFEHAGAETDRREVKAVCEAHGDVAFVDHAPGETSGHVRFVGAAAASAALAALTAAPVELGGGTPSWSLVEPAAEDAYRQAVQQRRGGGGRGGGGGGPSWDQAPAEPQREVGCLLHFDGAGAAADREGVNALIASHDLIAAHVDYRRGEPAGYVRFGTAGAAQAALAALTSPAADLGGATPVWSKVEAEAEEAYFERVKAARGKGKGKGKGKGGKGKGGKGGGGFGRGRGGGRSAPRGWLGSVGS